jgi:three-Cys-motif partner protein
VNHPKGGLALAAMGPQAQLDPLSELDFLRRYLSSRSQVFAREGHPFWIVNACAGGQTASAVSFARWIAALQEEDPTQTSRVLNLASDEPTMSALDRDLEPYQAQAVNVLGPLDAALDRVLRTIAAAPAFVVLDPFIGQGFRIDSLARLISRRGRRTELLLHLDCASLEKLTQDVSDERMDQIAGSSLWRRLWRAGEQQENLTRISVLYRACLQRRGYSHARKIVLCEQPGGHSQTQLVFATRSGPALVSMSDFVCRARRQISEDAPPPAGWELSERIRRFGADLGSASTNRILAGLCGELFGQFTTEEYRQAIGDLLARGTAVGPDRDSVTDEDTLRFDSATQMALFDTAGVP